MTATRRAYLIEQLAEMPQFLEKVFLGMPRDLLARAPEEDNLSLVEHLWHINHCESELYYPRIAQTLDHDKPAMLPAPDIGSWPAARAYVQRDGDDAIREFVTLRQSLIERLRDLETDQFERTSVRQNGTSFTVYDLLEHLADHDRDHRWRMGALLRRSLPA
jgi:uncharacterized damage-inducible protein DinB